MFAQRLVCQFLLRARKARENAGGVCRRLFYPGKGECDGVFTVRYYKRCLYADREACREGL